MTLDQKTKELRKKAGVAICVGLVAFSAFAVTADFADYQRGTIYANPNSGIIFHDTDSNGVVSWHDTLYVPDTESHSMDDLYSLAERVHNIRNERISDFQEGSLYAAYRGGLGKVNDAGRLQQQFFSQEDTEHILSNILEGSIELELYKK